MYLLDKLDQGMLTFVLSLFDPYEYHMNLCSESCSYGQLAGHPAVRPSCVAKTLMLDITHKLLNQICL